MDKKESFGPDNSSIMMKISSFIVDKRMLFFLIYTIAAIFSAFSGRWVKVENDITKYLDASTETRSGIDLMKEEFITYGSAKVMIANIPFDEAKRLERKLKKQRGMSDVVFTSRGDDQEDFIEHYNNGSALFDITFDYDEDDERSLECLEEVQKELSDYDIYISTSLGDQDAENLAQEMKKIIVIVAFVVVGVLLFTCQSFGEVPVLLITFLSAMILNNGTNFLFGTISYVSNSVSSILQLALSLDYAIILNNHYKEERTRYGVRDASVVALSVSIPEICASSLTTISGMFAMVFMQFGIGKDLGIILIKAILLSLLSVFTLMPGLLVMFAGAIERLEHKNFVPKINRIGRWAYRSRKVVPVGFLVIFVVAGVLSQKCPYVYGESLLVTPVLSESKKAQLLIDENFGKKNIVAVMLPGHDYEAESNYIKTLEGTKEVNTVTGLANTEVEDGYMLTDRLTPRELSEVMDIEYEVCVLLYEAYAADQDEYGRIITGVSNYRIPLMDVVSFAAEKVRDGYVELDESTTEDLFDADDQIREGRDQLEGENYDRILVDLALPEESDKTYDFLEQMHQIGADYYDRSNEIYVVGDSTSDFELKQAFDLDNIIVSVVSILFVLVVLLFTFNSIGLPLMQILVIEGAIFINFAIPAVFGWNIFFLSYLIVSSIQMGANIDYAIVISTRYIESRKRLNREESIIEALNFAIATIISSGTIMVLAGTAIGMMSSGPSIVGLGQALGRGTVISIILVLFVLPQILILGDGIIRATSFEPYRPIQTREEKGDLYLNGTIQGEVNGTLIGRYIGVIRGEANVSLVAGGMEAVESNVADQIERLIRESEAGGMQEGSDPVRSSEGEGGDPS